ncbi:hypothetical protein LguiB_029501 [Lonicera macranthoides]
MDRQLRASYGSMNTIKSNDEYLSILSDRSLLRRVNLSDKFIDRESQPKPSNFVPTFGMNSKGDSHEDCDFSDIVLKYINQMLMEEDIEEKTCMFQESAALQAAEKSFYDVLVERYRPQSTLPLDQNVEIQGGNCVYSLPSSSSSDNSGGSSLLSPGWNCDISDYEYPQVQNVSVELASGSQSQSSISSNSTGNPTDGLVDSLVSTLRIPDIFRDSQSVMQFKRGVEEARKFLPNQNNFSVDLGDDTLLMKEQKKENPSSINKVEKTDNFGYSFDGSRGKKNPFPKDEDLEEGRSNKQSALYTESTVRSDLFDLVLLCNGGRGESALREALHNGASKNMQNSVQSKGPNSGKGRGKKQGGNQRDVVDLRTLLTICAQAVATDDRRSANELLNQIRQHSSPTGDGMQRLAHYFAGGLEARMAGSGTQIYRALITMPTSAADVLKGYHVYLATCPFRKMTNFFSNKTIMKIAEKVTRLHIIDFGIYYGFQWPCLIQRLSSRSGGPPQLRITGIDFPHPGFRPSERVEETGRRLAHYADTFKVPFQFNAIAKRWETIQIEDLKIDEDEMVVVNCLYRFRNLLDETVVVDSPRNIVLNLIRKINPAVFIHGNVNGSYNAPFFITRFREALFHFSSLFDMFEANVPREIQERELMEKIIFGREAMNVIACEGAERIERPETYKQAQVRNLRAGFRQLPLDREIMAMSKDRVKSFYHKDFVIDEDGPWMLQGWKGRIVYALSTWRAA